MKKMKYIRTKDGIYKINWFDADNFRDEKGDIHSNCEIINEADTIEDLIMPGDLVRYNGLYMCWVEKDRGDKIRGIDVHLIDMHLIPRKSVDMLWIPTGNDNLKLVASKEDDKGEFELL